MLAALLVAAVAASVASGDSAGPRNPNAAVDATGIGTVAWINTTYAYTSNDQRATANSLTTGVITHYLKLSGFAFSVPSDATINGVTVSVERRASGTANIRDASIKLVNASGAVAGTEHANTATAWPNGTDGTASYGSGSDLWGLTLTPATVNDPDFGVAIAAKHYSGVSNHAQVDTATITVTYTTGGGGATSWTATNFSDITFVNPAAPYSAWVGAWKDPANGDLWMAYASSSGTQGAGSPAWVDTRLGFTMSADRDHWDLTNTIVYYKSTDHGSSWAAALPVNGVADAMRTWDPTVNNCNESVPTDMTSGANCPVVFPHGFMPQAHIKLANGTLVRRVNGEDIKYDRMVKATAYIQKLAPGAGQTWSAPQYLLDPAVCTCTYQISRIQRLADGRLIALGQKWDAYNPKGSTVHLLVLLGDATATTWTEALTFSGGEPVAGNEWDVAELPNGDLMAVFRLPAPGRKQGLLRYNGSNSWNLAAADVKTPPFTHSGHPELLATSAGTVLYLATDDTSSQRGIWYLSNTNAQASSTSWTKLPFTSNGGGTSCTLVGSIYNCSTRYYPMSFEDCYLGVCTIYVFSHVGFDQPYTPDPNQSIRLQKFQLTSP